MNKNLSSKLKTYTILAGSALTAASAKADIVYTDINDVSIANNGQFYDLDLNNDGVMDFKLEITKVNNIISSYYYSSYNFYKLGVKYKAISLQPLNTNEAIVSGGLYIDALNLNAPINQQANWNANQNNLGYFLSYYYSSPGGTSNSATSKGLWNNKLNKYIGLKLLVSGKVYYGWVRLDVANMYDSFIVKDYAFQDCPTIPIKAGDQGNINTDIALNVNAQDVANSGNASDMQVSFTKAADETKISTYRLMVVKAAQAGTFGISDAKNVLPTSYISHTPNGNNFQANLATNFTDTDGDAILQNVAYKVFVLSIPDGINATSLQLTSQTGTVTLSVPQSISEKEVNFVNIYSSNKMVFVNCKQTNLVGKQIDILSVQGKIIETISIQDGLNTIDLAKHPSGVYIVRLNDIYLTSKKIFLE